MLLTLQSPQRKDFLSQRPFAVTLSGITGGKFPIELPLGRSVIQRPPTEWEEVEYCVCLSVFGWWRFVCLAVISVLSAALEYRGKAKGTFLKLYSLVECVHGFCRTRIACSLHPPSGQPRRLTAVLPKQKISPVLRWSCGHWFESKHFYQFKQYDGK